MLRSATAQRVHYLSQVLRTLIQPHMTSSSSVNGAYQQMLGNAKPAQMLQVKVDEDLNCYPEISANKYAINLRFISMSRTEKPHQCERDIPFSLTLGNL